MELPFSKLISAVVDKGGEIISKLVQDKDLARKLTHEFKMQMNENTTEIALAAEETTRELAAADAKIREAELHQSDLYTKRTRPKVARQSWYLAIGYTILTVASKVVPASWGIPTDVVWEWQIFMAIASPAFAYMGIRGFDKWKNGGKA